MGSRYVPIFADPIEWDNHRSYESLTIVTHDGESYTSRCNVGPGIDITNERYWAKTGAYNAQLAQYRAEVKDLSAQVTGFASDNAEFRKKIDQYDKDNAAMKNTVAANNARVDALAERVATAETEIDGLQATTAQHTTDLADLHAKDEDLQRQITSNDGDIAALQAKDTEQDSRLNGIDTKLKSHDASIAQNTTDIAKNTKNIQDNAANIAANSHELADHAEQLADHESRLTAQHKEITDNHTAIERLTSVTDGLRADLTEDEAKIESNRDAIAHIQEKDVQQDGRLDKLEECCDQAKAHFTQLDTKTDNTNTALTAEIDRAKAAELANGKLIAKNAAELANHATELADHEQRIAALEGDNATNKQEIADLKAKNTQQDTAISGNTDSITHINENLGDWATAHPGQTVAQCVTSQENELAEHAGSIAQLESDKANKADVLTLMNWADWKAAFIADNDQTGVYIIYGVGLAVHPKTKNEVFLIAHIPVKDGTYTLDTGYFVARSSARAPVSLATTPISITVKHGQMASVVTIDEDGASSPLPYIGPNWYISASAPDYEPAP